MKVDLVAGCGEGFGWQHGEQAGWRVEYSGEAFYPDRRLPGQVQKA